MSPFSDHIAAAEDATGHTFHRVLFLDLETRSELNLRKIDAHTYANHPSTEIMCARWAIDDGPIQHWDETYPEPLSRACPLLSDKLTLVCVHNAEFEPKVLRAKAGIDLPIERLLDSAAVARAAGLPGDLDNLAQFFGGEKDKLGRACMLKLSRPRTKSKKHPAVRFWTPAEKPDDFELMYAYCGWDVHEMRRAMQYMPPLSPFEVKVYRATYRMNERGFPVDRPSAKAMQWHVDRDRKRMSDEVEAKYGFTLTQVKDIAAFLGLPSIAKAPLRDYLKDPFIPDAHRWVAEARQTYAKTSVDKIKAMLARSSIDGRVHDGVIYGAAERTLRFAGAGVQPQNLVRGMGDKQIDVFEAIHDGTFELVWGDCILPTIAECIRGLIADLGRYLNVADYSQIEARLLAWIVGDADLLGAFARGDDPYKMMAAKIYGKPVEEITGTERFMGKQTVLGCGYGLGGGGFQFMLDTTYDVQIEREEADELVALYRKNARPVVKFWRRLDNALAHASENVGTEFAVIKGKISIKFTRADRFWLKLPSGRLLRYYEVEKKVDRRGRISWSCFGRLKNGGGYGRVKIYGGALTGHIVQSTARDIMASAMVRLDDLGHKLVLTVHDELVAADDGRFDEFKREMTTRPAWLTKDFPLATDAFQTERYRK